LDIDKSSFVAGYIATSIEVWKDSSTENKPWGGVSISTDF